MKHFLLTLMACLLTIAGMQAQTTDYRQRQLTMDDGLPSNSVRNIVQDRRGFLWMGTDNGLCRYDGTALTAYRIAAVGTDQFVSALLSAGDDGLFVGTAKGAYYFSFATEEFEPLPLDGEVNVTHLSRDRDGNLWVATMGQGVSCLTSQGELRKNYPLTEISGRVAQVYADADNQLWAITIWGKPEVWRLNKSKDEFEPAGLQADTPYGGLCMLQISDGSRWIGTWEHGLMLLHDDARLEAMPAPQTGHCLHVHTLFELSPQQLLVGCDDGLWLFDTRERTYSLYLPQRFVYAVERDREGGLWVGTYYGGVTYVSPIAHRFDATPGGIISRFCEDRRGRIWVASDDSGISCYYRRQRIGSFAGSEKLQHLNAHALCMDGDDLWIGTYTDGVYVLNTVSGQLRQYAPGQQQGTLYDPNSYAIMRDREGTIWVATLQGLCRYQPGSDSFQRVTTLPSVAIDMDEDLQGRLWISTQGGGLFRLDPDDKLTPYKHSDTDEATLSDNMVNCAHVDTDGVLWVGTQGGLCRYDAQQDCFVRIRLDVPKQAVASIVEDQGVLWLSGDCGVLKYSPKGDVLRFTRQDGLVSEQFQPNSGLKASDGRIFFGTIRGFNAFYPYQLKVNQQLPPVYITHLEIFNRPIDVGSWRLPEALPYLGQLDVWYNDRVFSLAFASLSYCSPEKNMYAYMMEGFDKDWNYVGHEHKATYTNLPAGTYTFRVRATNNDGIWSDQEARLKIVVHPPFWWSLPAKIFYGLLIVGLLWLYLHLRLRRAERRHKQEISQLNEAKEKEVRDARMEFFTMIAHEIRTPVSLIIGPLENMMKRLDTAMAEGKAQALGTQFADDLRVIHRNAHRLLELVNQLLDFRKVQQKNLEMHFSVQNVSELLRAVAEGFGPALRQAGKQFNVTYPDEHFTAIIDREALTKVVSNLLTNASKYTKDRVELRCDVLPDGEHWQIEVEDNGMGIRPEDCERIFQPFFQAMDNKPGTGIGLSIVKNIVDQHQGQISIASEVGRGSIFRVVLPVKQPLPAVQNHVAESDEDGRVMSDETAGTAVGTTLLQAAQAAREPAAASDSGRPKMLIVDDSDDMLTFLATNFMDDYEVLTARDGLEALDLLQKSIATGDDEMPTATIDIIVSDWMMPRMSGPELCRHVRQNADTSHIPFVLLTAKTDSQSKVQGMDVGADTFIEKPFSVKYLEACIRNLLDMRSRLRQLFTQQPLQPIASIAGNATDNEFLMRMNTLIEENFSNPELSVSFLADRLHISRSGLFSKIKSLADLTPNEMIQVVRLKKAATLLKEGKYHINEVCYMVGFNNPSYFAKCFQKQFGIRPGDFMNQQAEN